LAEYSARYDAFRAAGAEVVAISVDDEARSEPCARELGLKFPLLSDTRRETISAYGVLNRGEKGGIAFPAVFVIDRNRIVRYRMLEEMASRIDVDDLVKLVRAVSIDSEPTTRPRKRGVWPGAMFIRSAINMLRGVIVPIK
jgi:peroxiredoxin